MFSSKCLPTYLCLPIANIKKKNDIEKHFKKYAKNDVNKENF